MLKRRTFLAGLTGLPCAQLAAAQPITGAKLLTVFLPFGAGSGGDQHARLLTKEMSRLLGIPVVIDNKPGGNGAIAYTALKNAPASGLNVMLTTSTTQIINPILMVKPPFDPVRDIKPVAGLTKLYQVMVVRPDLPAKTVAEFVALAKAAPGKYTFASGTSAARLGGELFKAIGGVDLLNVPYKATPNAITDLAGGAIDMMFADLPVALPMVQSGRLRALAVGSPKRLRSLPDLPTLQEAGLPGYEFSVWSGLYVLPSVGDDVVARLNDVATRANRMPEVEKFAEGASLERFEASPAELARFQGHDLARWRELASKVGIKPE